MKAEVRIPADAAMLHRARCRHRFGELAAKMDVESAPEDMLAVLGDAESRARQHLIGLAGAVGGKDRRLTLAGGIHYRRKKI